MEQVDQLLALGHLAENVQAVADLRARQLAEVAVELFDQVGDIAAVISASVTGVPSAVSVVVPFVAVIGRRSLHQAI